MRGGGIVQAPNRALISLLAGIPGGLWYHHARLVAAGAELGYEQGGLNTVMSPWPGSGQPWRPRLDTDSLRAEVFHLRTACWIVIAYLSGMRDTEKRAELHQMQHSSRMDTSEPAGHADVSEQLAARSTNLPVPLALARL
jgi:hypothetical protein